MQASPQSPRSSIPARVVLCLGAAAFTLTHIGYAVIPSLLREAPVMPGDAYTYMAKSVQLRDCLLQDCAAARDLLEQTRPTGKPEIDWARNRQFDRAIVQYHPLHSLLLRFLHLVSGRLEASYLAMEIAGALLLCAAVTMLQKRLFGEAAAGITLLWLSGTIFPGFHGFHWLVPWNMALGMGLGISALIANPDRTLPIALPLTVAAMALTHPLGQIYAALALLLFLLLPRRGRRLPTAAASAAVLGTVSLFLWLSPRPIFRFAKHPGPAGFDQATALLQNFSIAWQDMQHLFAAFEGLVPALLVAAIGLLFLEGTSRRTAVKFLLSSTALALLSLFVVLPRYPAEAYQRLSIPALIVVFGLLGKVGAALPHALDEALAMRRKARVLSIVLLLLFLGRSAWLHVAEAQRNVSTTLGRLSRTADFRLPPAQPIDLLKAKFQPRDVPGAKSLLGMESPELLDGQGPLARTVGLEETDARIPLVFMNEVPMMQYLCYGAWRRHLVFYPAIRGTPEETRWLNGRKIVVAVHRLPNFRFAGSFRLTSVRPLRIERTERIDWGTFSIRLRDAEPGTRLALTPALRGNKPVSAFLVDVPEGYDDWHPLPVSPDAANSASIGVSVLSGAVTLAGIRQAPPLRWPWELPIQVRCPADDEQKPPIVFRAAQLVPPGCTPRKVLDDRGVAFAILADCKAPDSH